MLYNIKFKKCTIIFLVDFTLHNMGIGSEGTDCCGKCGEPITGKAMKAKELLYHEDKCFSCSVCRRDLKTVPVYSRDGKLYCEKDYRENFVPKCAQCNDFVLDVCSKAMIFIMSDFNIY